jgi:hypothetical protein
MSGTHVPEEVSSQLGYTDHENSVPNAPIQKDRLSGVDSGSLHEIQVTETDRTDETDETDVDLHIKQTMEIMAEGMSQMEVVNPEVLRVTQACRAFDHFAAALRSGTSGNQRDFYHKSRKSHKISTFWSHSWHGGHWKKISTLIIFYNGTAAVSMGIISGVVAMLLFRFGVLPGFETTYDGYMVKASVWSICSGFLVTCLVTIFWRPQSQVFFDRICISQTDSDLKVHAVFSLSGLLRKTDTLLILWDPTWTERLWCLFELAAFLQSKKSGKKALMIRPIFLGPVSIVVFVTFFVTLLPGTFSLNDSQETGYMSNGAVMFVGLATMYPAVSAIRNYFRELDTMKQQLLSISFDSTRCACCSLGHVYNGVPVPCDRKIVKECVKTWFCSLHAFEATVRSEVLEVLNHDLSEKVFSTWWILGVTAPIILAFMDLSATQVAGGPATAFVLQGLVIWLLAFPATNDLLISIPSIMRARPQNLALEVVKNAVTLLLMAFPLAMIAAVHWLAYSSLMPIPFGSFGDFREMVYFACFCGFVLVLSLFHYLLGVGLKALRKWPGW